MPANTSVSVPRLVAGSDIASILRSMRRSAHHIVRRLRACHESYQTARMYEELHCLSDIELARRGLNRASLGYAMSDGS